MRRLAHVKTREANQGVGSEVGLEPTTGTFTREVRRFSPGPIVRPGWDATQVIPQKQALSRRIRRARRGFVDSATFPAARGYEGGICGYTTHMGQSSTLEYEVKFEVAPELALPDLRPLVGGTVRLAEQRLVTTYFETADRRLWREGLTLRHRMTEGDEVGIWTLKLPPASDGSTLDRNELSWPAPADVVPAAVTDVLQGVLRHRRLGPLVTLETTRQRLVLHGDRETLLAELDDDHVLVVGGPRDGLQFRQVELELIEHGWEGREVIRRLEAAGARVEPAPKLAKAVDLARASSTCPTLDQRATVAASVQWSVRSDLDRLVSHDWRLRLASPGPTPRDVHQARVATRRLRSNLKTFGPVLDPVWTRHVRRDLKWLGAALGEIRDADVLAGQLNDAPELLKEKLAAQRSAACRQLEDVLESKRYLDLLDLSLIHI